MKKIETKLICKYNDYINKCFIHLDNPEENIKKEFTIIIHNIYKGKKI